MTNPEPQPSTQPPRPPFQFSLWTLLLLFVVLGSSLAVFGAWGILLFGLVVALAVYVRYVDSRLALEHFYVIFVWGLLVLYAVLMADGSVKSLWTSNYSAEDLVGRFGETPLRRRKGVRNRSLDKIASLGYARGMGRPKRAADGGLVYHVLNRANARMTIFEKAEDYAAFERVLEEAVERTKTRLLAYCAMPTHWHLVLWPQDDGELSRFTGWLTLTHTQRWHAHRHSTGSGHLYQGRFKSFPVQDDEHLFTVCRYVERNALRANLVRRTEDWRWGSLHRWHNGSAKEKLLLAAWPLRRLPGWLEEVNAPQTDAELSALRRAVNRGSPFGESGWSEGIVRRLGLESTLRPRGRPKKPENGS